MRKLFALLLLISVTAKAQESLETIEATIKNLPAAEIGAWWVALYKSDQDNNGGEVLYSEATDAVNLYKSVLMVYYHGYPTVKQYGYPAYTAPWLTWTHCNGAGLKQYTFSLILKGKELGQLPNDRFPNYFVGGWLLDLYGLDMEFDPGFNRGTGTMIDTSLQPLTGNANPIKTVELKTLVTAYLTMLALQPQRTLGDWVFMQYEEPNTFSIVQLTDGNWYLFTRTGEYNRNRRLMKADAILKRFDFVDGFGAFYLVVESGKLEIRDKEEKVVRISE
jgi:hypothetical protein